MIGINTNERSFFCAFPNRMSERNFTPSYLHVKSNFIQSRCLQYLQKTEEKDVSNQPYKGPSLVHWKKRFMKVGLVIKMEESSLIPQVGIFVFFIDTKWV